MQRVIRLFGHICGDEAELAFDDLHLEPWQLVVERNAGFAAALYSVSLGRIYSSARSAGYGRWAAELALKYAQTREAFGHAIADYQGVSFPWPSRRRSCTLHRAMHVHGGMGFTIEVGLTEARHRLCVVNVSGGTNEILNRTISQRLFKGDTALYNRTRTVTYDSSLAATTGRRGAPATRCPRAGFPDSLLASRYPSRPAAGRYSRG